MIFKKSKKIFIHVDCDSFFAECEILKNPKLKNRYVLVWEEIVLACNYKTKAFWIKTWTPIWQAKQILGNKGVYLKSDYQFYCLISSKMMRFLSESTLSIEPFSIDEAFCEITWLPELNKMPLEKYIKKLQKDIVKNIWIPVSIWVSNTRIKAKIFSKLNKPKWFFIDSWDNKELFTKLKLAIVPFIWTSMQKQLKYKCENILDFMNLGYWYLKRNFWKTSVILWLELSWIDVYVVKKSKISKSISRWRSFNKQITNNKSFLFTQLLINFNYLYDEFILKEFETKKVSIFFRDKEKITHVFNISFQKHIFKRDKLLKAIKALFEKHYNEYILYRSTGIIFWNLKKKSFHQTSFFDKNNHDTDIELNLILNEINHKFGSYKICFWTHLLGQKFNLKLWVRK